MQRMEQNTSPLSSQLQIPSCCFTISSMIDIPWPCAFLFFFGCFMGKYILWIFAVFHFDKEHICLIVGIQFNEFIFIIHALAGFNCIIKQVRKQAGYRNI